MPTSENYPCRVFISYSHKDKCSAVKLVKHLNTLGFHPVWDENIRGGSELLDSVMKQISYSHILIAILTPQSGLRSWVNHEIGYALGRDVPILPLCLGYQPKGMIFVKKAIVAKDIKELLRRLTPEMINSCLKDAKDANAKKVPMYECADLIDTRSQAIVSHCKEVEKFLAKNGQPIRHLAAFGSFSIPETKDQEIWEKRHMVHRLSQHQIDWLNQERVVLEEYTLKFGCDLILYPIIKELPYLNNVTEIETRLETLHSFLCKMRDKKARVRVVFHESALKENLLIVGDWFFAESITPRPEGYRHTTITCHASTVLEKLNDFDKKFEKFREKHMDMSVEEAIRRIEEQQTSIKVRRIGEQRTSIKVRIKKGFEEVGSSTETPDLNDTKKGSNNPAQDEKEGD